MAKLFKSGQISESPSTTIQEKRTKIALDLVLIVEENYNCCISTSHKWGGTASWLDLMVSRYFCREKAINCKPCTLQAHQGQSEKYNLIKTKPTSN